VDQELLIRYGAVSAPVVKAMARGAKRLAGADFALALSGIAGPAGGNREKPVGLVYIALEGTTGTKVAKHNFQGERSAVKNQSARKALLMLREALLEQA
jgi:nicotinamide-nucleotide amidase